MRHAIEATRDTSPLLSMTNDTSLTDTKIDKYGVSFFFPEAILGLVGVFCEALSMNNVFDHELLKAMQIHIQFSEI